MVTDEQVRRLKRLMETGTTLTLAAARSGMDEKAARKYWRSGRLPSECRVEHTWRTRADAFEAVWEGVRERLAASPGLEAKALFADLQRRHPGRFADGQLRAFQPPAVEHPRNRGAHHPSRQDSPSAGENLLFSLDLYLSWMYPKSKPFQNPNYLS
jgi:hypothetical protein